MAGLRGRRVQFTYLPVLFLISSTLGPSCTTRQAAPLDSARPGDRIATIPASSVDTLTILKNDPASGDRWSLQVNRAHPKAALALQWEIHAEPPLSDARADGELIAHLLDSLESAKIAGVPRPSPLEAAGLKPPRFTLRWKSANGSEELEIGARAFEPGQVYARVPRLSPTRPVKIRGSLLGLLAELSSLERLRQRSWSSTAADDFDEVELKRKGKTVFYAQRERDLWTDRAHKRVKKDAGRLLSLLVGAPIREFLDDEKASREAASELKASTEYQAVFTDRTGQKTILTLSRPGKSELIGALSSERPESPFRLDRAVLHAWDF
jgi:hypothetical protein